MHWGAMNIPQGLKPPVLYPVYYGTSKLVP